MGEFEDKDFVMSTEVQTEYERGRMAGIASREALANEVLQRTMIAEEENETLRNHLASARRALEEIAIHPEKYDGPCRSYAVGWAFWNVQNIARAALKETGSDPGTVAVASGWQDIETAPKDGTPILAANSRHDIHAPVVVRWDGRDQAGADPHWCDAATRDGEALYFNPNYFDLWMPAPVVPSTLLDGGDQR